MSEQEQIKKMEPAEYMEYIRQQVKDTPEEEKKPVAQLTMYDMNKDLIKGLKKMTNMEINHALEKVEEWFWQQEATCNHYALLNHDKHYFTIFAVDPKWKLPITAANRKLGTSFIAQVKDIITNYYGDNDIRAIDVDTNGAIEIWGMWDGEPTVAYLFPYEEGVVYY